MPILTAGRTLDRNGLPIEGTGFEYDSDGRLAELLAQRVSPLCSQPITGEWVFGLVSSKQTRGEFERGVGIFRPGNAGPPEHIHPTYDEDFSLVQGEFIFKTPQGQPKFLQVMVIGSEYADDTVFTHPPPGIAIPIAKALAPLGRVLGYRPTYARYLDETYWGARVEQPRRDETDPLVGSVLSADDGDETDTR